MRVSENSSKTALHTSAIIARRNSGRSETGHSKSVVRTAREEVEAGLEGLLTRMWRFAMTRCGDQATADDLVQATCTRALERADQFTCGTRLDSWLFTILNSIWLNTVRSQGVRRGNGLVDVADAYLESADADEDTRVQLADTLRHIADLPSSQRSALLLVCVDGLSYREAAQALDVPVGTVMSRLAAARGSLRESNDRQSASALSD
ncbi:MAG: RNA polymerase sigma factor [Pseudomonadota bacterium]